MRRAGVSRGPANGGYRARSGRRRLGPGESNSGPAGRRVDCHLLAMGAGYRLAGVVRLIFTARENGAMEASRQEAFLVAVSRFETRLESGEVTAVDHGSDEGALLVVPVGDLGVLGWAARDGHSEYVSDVRGPRHCPHRAALGAVYDFQAYSGGELLIAEYFFLAGRGAAHRCRLVTRARPGMASRSMRCRGCRLRELLCG